MDKPTQNKNERFKPKQQSDLRALLLILYLKNNPQMEHNIYIYSFHGVVDVQTNPFHFVSGQLPPNVKKSIVLQNIPSGEMMQAFISPVENTDSSSDFQIENTVVYGNKSGMLASIALDSEKVMNTEKYKQFYALAQSLMRQFY